MKTNLNRNHQCQCLDLDLIFIKSIYVASSVATYDSILTILLNTCTIQLEQDRKQLSTKQIRHIAIRYFSNKVNNVEVRKVKSQPKIRELPTEF